ncbi:MAG: PEP-CTERM sorting domain-containing protein [Phycisphaerales bacterium]|nr:PEP-CTERM sorting domain-containing protein [Phycisphaerales bacterium]MCB9864569.1 PEP-CTERM sorting domain-containing protein [Phycisphaerales bacterium]
MQSRFVMKLMIAATLFGAAAAHASMIVGYDIPQMASGYSTLAPIPGGAPEVSATPMTATMGSLSNATIANHFRFNGWVPTVNASRYITTTFTVDPGKLLNLSNMTYSVEDLPHSGTLTTFHVRTSLDGFASDIDAFSLTMPGVVTDRTTDLSILGAVGGSIEFRFYATTLNPAITMGFANHLPGGAGGGLPDVGQNIRFNGEIVTAPEPGTILLVGLAAVGIVRRQSRIKTA